jgi:hypothetical protein
MLATVRIHTLLAGLMIVAASASVPAQSKLQTKVFTSTPEGVSVTSTLIYGDTDAKV